MNPRTFEDLMNPKQMEIQARYENARLGVNMGWTIASKKTENKEDMAILAGWLAKRIENDFNSALAILEVKDGTTGSVS